MGIASCLVAATVSLATIATGPDSPSVPVGESRLAGPGTDISVAIPAGWHQVPEAANPQLLQMVYPDNCTEQLKCASAAARVLTIQAANAQGGALTGEQAIAGQKGIQDAAVTSEGPIQIAGRSGYQVHFTFTAGKSKFQAVTAAVETGLPSAGTVPTALIFVTVSDLAGAPPTTVMDQIVGSAQMKVA